VPDHGHQCDGPWPGGLASVGSCL